MYLLDTNVCIGYLNGVAVGVLRRMRMLSASEIAVCSVVKAELFYGAMKSGNPARALAEQQRFVNQFISFSFDDQAAEHYGRIRAHLARRGQPIGPNDLLIASIALARGAILVTHNAAEFGRVPSLVIEDWEVT